MSQDLKVARLVDATPEEVFDAFTNPAGQEAFYGQDDPCWLVRSHCDLRVGGVWTVDFGSSPRELYRHRHVFEIIERARRLLLSTTETGWDGSTWRLETEFRFGARGERTLWTMTQRGIPTAELREEHRRGVPNAVTRLERLIRLSRTRTGSQHDPTR